MYWTTLGVFERRTATGSECIEFLSGVFGQIFGASFLYLGKDTKQCNCDSVKEC